MITLLCQNHDILDLKMAKNVMTKNFVPNLRDPACPAHPLDAGRGQDQRAERVTLVQLGESRPSVMILALKYFCRKKWRKFRRF
jgi:hypothetical protein